MLVKHSLNRAVICQPLSESSCLLTEHKMNGHLLTSPLLTVAIETKSEIETIV